MYIITHRYEITPSSSSQYGHRIGGMLYGIVYHMVLFYGSNYDLNHALVLEGGEMLLVADYYCGYLALSLSTFLLWLFVAFKFAMMFDNFVGSSFLCFLLMPIC